jgi:hypothetical protein
MSLKLSLFRFLGEHRCRSNSGSELLWRSRIGRDLAPALHEIRWKSLTDRIDREVRLGTLPQPPTMSFSAALMSAAPHPPGEQVKGMPAASGGGQLFAIWGGTMAQTCRAHCHPGGAPGPVGRVPLKKRPVCWTAAQRIENTPLPNPADFRKSTRVLVFCELRPCKHY